MDGASLEVWNVNLAILCLSGAVLHILLNQWNIFVWFCWLPSNMSVGKFYSRIYRHMDSLSIINIVINFVLELWDASCQTKLCLFSFQEIVLSLHNNGHMIF